MQAPVYVPVTLFLRTVILGMLAACTEGLGPRSLVESHGIRSLRAPVPESSARSASPQSAIIIRNNGCVLLDGDGGIVEADRNIVISTQSTGRNATLICKVKSVANSAGQAATYDSENNPLGPGVVCAILRPQQGVNVFTTDWKETVSASGNATIRCHYKL